LDESRRGVSRSSESELQREMEETFQRNVEEPWRGAGLYGSYLNSPEDIRRCFIGLWPAIEKLLDEPIGVERALLEMRDLVVYDIPDGTRTTLTMNKNMDVQLDAGMWCLAFAHTLRSLGARKVVLMTHTAYNRERGCADTQRILTTIERGIAPMADYCSRNKLRVNITGMSDEYELGESVRAAFPPVVDSDFEISFLVDYREEFFLEEEGRRSFSSLPEIDVVIRHTKLHISGGWLPTKTLHSTYLYSQNGTLYSNWTYDEQVALVAVALLAKQLNDGEILTKTYASIDDVKRRHQSREMNLSNRTLQVRPTPKKLLVMGSPLGLVQIYY